MAQKKGADLRYVSQDHLTGTALVTDGGGNQVGATMRYLPFGAARPGGSVPTDRKFTGQRLDGSGLYYYGARYYDAEIGRFISADTIVPAPANPQNFARYAYTLNNPLRYTDPTGHEELEVAVPQEAFTATAELAVNVGMAVTASAAAAVKAEAEKVLELVAGVAVATAQVGAARTATVHFEVSEEATKGALQDDPGYWAPQLEPQKVIQVYAWSPVGLVVNAINGGGPASITLNGTVITTTDLSRPDDRFKGYIPSTALEEAWHAEQQRRGAFYLPYLKEHFKEGYAGNKFENEAKDFAQTYEHIINPVIIIDKPWWFDTYENE